MVNRERIRGPRVRRLEAVLALGITLLISAGPASGEPVLSLGTAEAVPGALCTLELRLSGGAEPYAGVNAKIALPAGVTFLGAAEGALLSAGDFTVDSRDLSGTGSNVGTVIAYSATDTFAASEGVVLRLDLLVASDTAAGTYPVSFAVTKANTKANVPVNPHALSNSDGSQSISPALVSGSISVEGAPPDEDLDDDGLPDAWEVHYFGDITSEDGYGDPDEDDLANAGEYELGTNPIAPDTDGDGLTDGDEVLLTTDPLNPDTDGDTLTDGEEVLAYLTNPLTWDTDGDTMDDAWELLHGLDPNDPTDASADPDDDGRTNAEEYANDTDPGVDDPPPVIGDVNGDAGVDALDATLITLSVLMGDSALDAYLMGEGMGQARASCADVNLDDSVDALDATLVNLVLLMGKDSLNAYLTNEGMAPVHTGETTSP